MKQKTDWLNVVKYAGAYIAFIIGSGFATGQEIIQFYTSYGIWGIGSVAISMFLFAWVGGTVTDMGFRTKGMEKVNAYGQICGKWLGTFYEYFVRIFLFAVVVVMISGAGAMLNEYYGPNYYVGSLLMAVLIFVAFAFGFNKLLDVIGCIGPVIIVFSIVVAVATIVSGSGLDLNVDITPIANMRSSANWWISGILYASYIGLNKEALLVEAGDKHGDLFDLKCLVGGGYIAGTLGEKQDLHLLLLGIQLRLPFCTGSQRTLIDGDILVLAGQNALTSQTVFVEYLLVFACFVKLDGRHLFFILSLFRPDQSTLLRKSCVRLFWGLLNNSSGVFSSTITPPSMNNTRSPTSRAKPIS